MKIYIPNTSEMSIGGGWNFLRNIKKGLQNEVEFVDNLAICDILFINSASMTDTDDVEEAHKMGKRIVFRVDNIPKKSRNKRGRIYDKMRRFGELADIVVYQSNWAKEYAGYMVGTKYSMVIHNGVDTSIFNQEDRQVFTDSKYLFIQGNRDENKRFPEAAYWFHMIHRQFPTSALTIVGKFSPETIDANFDFFDGENITYIPPIENQKELASIYKSHNYLLFPAFADACPNTVAEARACGLEVLLVNEVGGTKDLLDPNLDISLERMCREYLQLFNLLVENI
jgi:glycosyltransferase involved in cell wall biosynthesis